MVIPFGQIKLYDINNDLEGHNDDLKVQIEDKVVHFNAILFRDDGLFVENPKQKHEEDWIEQGDIVVSVALKFA